MNCSKWLVLLCIDVGNRKKQHVWCSAIQRRYCWREKLTVHTDKRNFQNNKRLNESCRILVSSILLVFSKELIGLYCISWGWTTEKNSGFSSCLWIGKIKFSSDSYVPWTLIDALQAYLGEEFTIIMAAKRNRMKKDVDNVGETLLMLYVHFCDKKFILMSLLFIFFGT
jgi:hypothetical protein